VYLQECKLFVLTAINSVVCEGSTITYVWSINFIYQDSGRVVADLYDDGADADEHVDTVRNVNADVNVGD